MLFYFLQVTCFFCSHQSLRTTAGVNPTPLYTPVTRSSDCLPTPALSTACSLHPDSRLIFLCRTSLVQHTHHNNSLVHRPPFQQQHNPNTMAKMVLLPPTPITTVVQHQVHLQEGLQCRACRWVDGDQQVIGVIVQQRSSTHTHRPTHSKDMVAWIRL